MICMFPALSEHKISYFDFHWLLFVILYGQKINGSQWESKLLFFKIYYFVFHRRIKNQDMRVNHDIIHFGVDCHFKVLICQLHTVSCNTFEQFLCFASLSRMSLDNVIAVHRTLVSSLFCWCCKLWEEKEMKDRVITPQSIVLHRQKQLLTFLMCFVNMDACILVCYGWHSTSLLR